MWDLIVDLYAVGILAYGFLFGLVGPICAGLYGLGVWLRSGYADSRATADR